MSARRVESRRAEDRKPAGNFNLPLMKDRFRNAAVTSDTPALFTFQCPEF